MFDPKVGVRNLQRRATRLTPVPGRRRGPNPLVASVSVAATASLAVIAGVLLWDRRRRAEMRRRLHEVAGSVGAIVNRAKPAAPVGRGRD